MTIVSNQAETATVADRAGASTPLAQLDLRQLAVDRSGDGRRDCAPHRATATKRLLTRYAIPAALLFGFLGLLVWSGRESLRPARNVTVIPALMTKTQVAREGTPLFQAAGWVEPRPTPIEVTALAEGVVERLLVVEGEAVAAGQPVATLIDVDARLSLERAEAELRLRQAEWQRAKARLNSAELRLNKPVHLESPLAEAEAMLARVQTELAALPDQLAAAEARERFCRLDWEGKSAAGAALPQRTIDQALSDYEAASAAVRELKSRIERLSAEATALTTRRDTLRRQLELKIEENRDFDEARADVRAAEALVQQAENAVNAARLRLERMVIRAPQDGRVLRLVARPGRRVGGPSPEGKDDPAVVITMYDPQMLQLRTDVPLDQVPRVRPGAPVKIETEAVPEPLEGEVLFKTAFTDLQKNTLDVKVAIKNPPADLRPDMLVRATFLAPNDLASSDGPVAPLRFVIPAALVENSNGETRVWIADQAAGVARLRTVRVAGRAGQGDLVEIAEGIERTDKLIVDGREGLRDGERIFVVGEDTTLGIETLDSRNPRKGIKRIVDKGQENRSTNLTDGNGRP